ncbi:MAG: hypothetical protein V4671_30035 [Armatimonadota bacterium]
MIGFVTTPNSIADFFVNLVFTVPLLGFVWLEMLAMPFIGFTFTDPADFVFITLIPLTLLGIAWQHLRRTVSAGWLRFAERAAFAFAILGPLVPLAALYLAAWSASSVIGHWPRYMIDDPKNISGQSYDLYISGVSYAMAFGGWSMIAFGALLLHLRNRIPSSRLVWMSSLSLIAWVLFVGEPGGRYLWWLD